MSKKETSPIEINFSKGFAHFLAAQEISIAFTSYQTGRLYLVGHGEDGKLSLHEAIYPQAMGVISDGQRIYLGTKTQVVRLENVLLPNQKANHIHDKVFVPRVAQTTGDIDIHELGLGRSGKLVFINTKYSCLCETSETHSFNPVWKPHFITKLAPEDRCHLNGLAMHEGKPKYVSAVCRSDVVDGWRDRRQDGGVIIDVDTQEVFSEGLSMPHSPRVHKNRLWVLNSGRGEIGTIDASSRKFHPFAFCPGFLRGLAFHGDFIFTTLSKPRHGRFKGLDLDNKLKNKDADAWCGVQILSEATGDVKQWIRFDGMISELFDICILPSVKNPLTVGPNSKEIHDFITFPKLA